MLIETLRLTITHFSLDMAHDVHLNSLDEDMRRFVPDEVFETEEEARDAIRCLIQCYEDPDGPYVYPITLRNGHTNIGYIQLAKIKEGWEIGYHIAKQYTGRGFATEAANAFLSYLFRLKKLDSVYGVCLTENTASRKVLEKCGFHLIFEGMNDYQGENQRVCKYLYERKVNR